MKSGQLCLWSGKNPSKKSSERMLMLIDIRVTEMQIKVSENQKECLRDSILKISTYLRAGGSRVVFFA